MSSNKKIPKNLSKFSKKELDSFFANAKRVHSSQAFTILIKKTDNPHGKILPIVSRKYGNAPARNLLKRRLRSIFREEELYEKQTDTIVIARAPGKYISFAKLKDIVVQTLS